MVFSSISFLFYILPLFWLIDRILKPTKHYNLRNLGIIFVSLVFYTWGEGGNVFLLIIIALINYILGRVIAKNKQKLVLTAGIALNLLTLFYYKYLAWVLSLLYSYDAISQLFPPPSPAIGASVMPLGISFFIFHAISYIIDVYREDIEPARSWADFFAYFCMFPHLVAGPIVRYAQVRHEIADRGPDWSLFNFGLYRFLIGLNKKVIIANSVSVLADAAFSQNASGSLGLADAWIGILAYSVQIYFDFSGYSDMAIGLAAMAGFKFEENFRRPYSAASIKDFWRRWHISLSSWFRDYLYIPLGGNRRGKFISWRNMIIVFFLCGLWHGANATFVVWGLWHGCFLIVERFKWVENLLNKVPAPLQRLYAMLVVLLGWVFFRAENMTAAMGYFASLGGGSLTEVTLTFHSFGCVMLVAALILCLLPDRVLPKATSHAPQEFGSLAFFLQMILAFFSLSMLLASARNPFIYFNF